MQERAHDLRHTFNELLRDIRIELMSEELETAITAAGCNDIRVTAVWFD